MPVKKAKKSAAPKKTNRNASLRKCAAFRDKTLGPKSPQPPKRADIESAVDMGNMKSISDLYNELGWR